MYVGKYLHKVRGLMNLKRYQNLFLHKQRSVAEHTWSVAKIAQALGLLEIKKFGNQVDMALLLQKVISHDDLELFTGDILSNTKRRTPAMRDAVNELEEVIFNEEYVRILPKGWGEEFRQYTLDAKEGIEGRILHASDIIDTILEAVDEIKLGNLEYFTDVLRNSTEKLLTIELDSVRHFLKHSLVDFGLDISKYYGESIYQAIEALKSGEDNDIPYVTFEEVMKVFHSGDDHEWIVLYDQENKEAIRFRNKSIYFIEVIENGVANDVRKDQFRFPGSAMLYGKWAIVSVVPNEIAEIA